MALEGGRLPPQSRRSPSEAIALYQASEGSSRRQGEKRGEKVLQAKWFDDSKCCREERQTGRTREWQPSAPGIFLSMYRQPESPESKSRSRSSGPKLQGRKRRSS